MSKKSEVTEQAKNKAQQASSHMGQEPPAQAEQQAEQECAKGEMPEMVQLTKEEFEAVRAHIETQKREKDEAVDMAQRIQAEFDNYRKRNNNLRQESHLQGTCDCMQALLPTLDNFERALHNAQGVEAAFVEGIRLIQKTLLDALGKLGLKEIEAEGVAFDPNLHNAVMQEEAEGKQSGEILEVLQKGYEVDGKIIRYSMVKVAR